MVECRGFMEEKNTVVTFDYKGFFGFSGFTGFPQIPNCPFLVLAVDMAGNINLEFFKLSEDASELPTIMKVSGDEQLARPGATLAHPLIVEVRDQSGNPLPDAQVTFMVTTGDGKLSGQFSLEQTTTNANGRAESILTLGTNPGANIVEVTIAGREPVTFNAKGIGTLTTPSEDGDLQKWHLPDGAILSLGKGLLGESSQSVTLSPDGQRLAVASGIGVWLYEVTTSRVLALLPTASQVISVSFSPDGTMLASGSSDATVKLWDVKTGRISTSFGPNPKEIEIVAFSPDGTTIASGWFGHDFNLWDVATGTNTLLSARKTGFGRPLSFSFSRDGILASGHTDGIILWDVATGTQITTLPSNLAFSVSFSPDGTTLAYGRNDGTILMWDVVTRENIATLAGHNGWVRSVSFSPDGTTLASGADDGTVLLWDMSSNIAPQIPNPDFDRDGVVGFADFLLFVAQFGLSRGDEGYDARFDLDGDGVIGFGDFLIFANDFGQEAS